MAQYKCSCNDEIVEATNVRIRFIDDEARHDIKCEKCGEYMDVANPKTGVPSFRRDSHGRVF
jgi:RNase P subunit RPR2